VVLYFYVSMFPEDAYLDSNLEYEYFWIEMRYKEAVEA
jgi:hypothetical protein